MRYAIIISALVATVLAGDYDGSSPDKTTSAEWHEKTTSAEYHEKTTSAEWPTKTTAAPPNVTPTWEAHPHPPPPKVDCKHVEECLDKADQCRTKPEANQAECSSELADCLGFNPFNPEADESIKKCDEEGQKPAGNGTFPKPPPVPPVIVSGSSNMAPLGLFSLLAAAAVALL
jgi:hypothetical protein